MGMPNDVKHHCFKVFETSKLNRAQITILKNIESRNPEFGFDFWSELRPGHAAKIMTSSVTSEGRLKAILDKMGVEFEVKHHNVQA